MGEYCALRASAALASLGACRCVGLVSLLWLVPGVAGRLPPRRAGVRLLRRFYRFYGSSRTAPSRGSATAPEPRPPPSSLRLGPGAALRWLLWLAPYARARSRASMARPVRSGPEPRVPAWLVPFRARSRVDRLGPAHSLGPGALMRLWLVPSPGPGAAQTALARPDSGPGPHLPPIG